jgi:hypothetical protein
MFDLNLEHGLPTPIGHLDSSAVLSFQWGRYQELTNLYSIATSLAKLHSTTYASYTITTNNEVDNFHNHQLYPSQWTNLSNKSTPPPWHTPSLSTRPHMAILTLWSPPPHPHLTHLD